MATDSASDWEEIPLPKAGGDWEEVPVSGGKPFVPAPTPPVNWSANTGPVEAALLSAANAGSSATGLPIGVPAIQGLKGGLDEAISGSGGGALERFKRGYANESEVAKNAMAASEKEHPIASTIGAMAPYINPYMATKGIAQKLAMGAAAGFGTGAAEGGLAEGIKGGVKGALAAGAPIPYSINMLNEAIGKKGPEQTAQITGGALGLGLGALGARRAGQQEAGAEALPKIKAGVAELNAPLEKAVGAKADANALLNAKAREQILGDFQGQQAAHEQASTALSRQQQLIDTLKAKREAAKGAPALQLSNLAESERASRLLADPNTPQHIKDFLTAARARAPQTVDEAMMGTKTPDEFLQARSGGHGPKIAAAEAKLADLIRQGQTPLPPPELRVPKPISVPPELIEQLRAQREFQDKNARLHRKASTDVPQPVPVEDYLSGKAKPPPAGYGMHGPPAPLGLSDLAGSKLGLLRKAISRPPPTDLESALKTYAAAPEKVGNTTPLRAQLPTLPQEEDKDISVGEVLKRLKARGGK